MIYFSELQGKKVYTEKGKLFGKVIDCFFVAAESPLVTKMLIKTLVKKEKIIPITALTELGEHIKIESEYKEEEVKRNEFSLTRNLLDKQIIDLKGGKVVRVNDVAIQDKENKEYYIAGVDIGFRAILRWIKLEKLALPFYRLLGIYSHPHFLSWADIEPLELARGNIRLKKDVEDLERMRPEDLADYLEKTTIRNVDEIVNTLKESFAAKVIGDLNVNYQTALFRKFAPEKAATLIDYLDPDEAVDILLTLSKEKRIEIINLTPAKKQKELIELLKYSKTPIGGLINPEFISVSSEDTVKVALETVKAIITDSHFSAYIYVRNNEELLIGVISLYQLITQPSDTPIYKIMEQNVVVIHLTTPKEIAIKKLLRYKLYALPVIENNKKIIGVVTYDDLVEDILKKL